MYSPDAASQTVIVTDERGPCGLDRSGRRRDPAGRQHRVTRGRTGPRQRGRHGVQDRVGRLPRRVRPAVPKSVTASATRCANRRASSAHDVPNADAPLGRPPSIRMSASPASSTKRRSRSAASAGSSTALRLLALCSAKGSSTPAATAWQRARRAPLRRLDLQHIGAEVGEQPADGVGFRATEIEHPDRRQKLTPVKHADQYRSSRRSLSAGPCRTSRPASMAIPRTLVRLCLTLRWKRLHTR